MDNRASRPSEAVRHERSTGSARTHRVNTVRGGYLVISLILVALYPLLPTAGRNTVFLIASFGALAAVLAALTSINPGHRRFWLLLLAALVATDVANIMSLSARGTAVSVNGPIDAVGNVLFLAAAPVLVLQRGATTWAASSTRPSARWPRPGCSGTSYSARACCRTTKRVRPS